jgi:hypothetical protein
MLGVDWSSNPKGQLPNEGGDQDQKTAQDAKCYGNHYSDGMEYLEM